MARSGWSAEVHTKSYINALKVLGRDALPDTVALTLNRTADAVTKQAKENVEKRLIVRRRAYTLGSLTNKSASPYEALNKALGHDIDRMFSRAGSFSPFLWKHDEGEAVTAEGSRIPIPTIASRTGKSRKKSIAKRYSMNQLGDIGNSGRYFIGRPKGGNRPLGIYERHSSNKKLRMLRNLTESSVRIPATHWFSDAVKKYGTPRLIGNRFMDAAQQRLRRFGVERK